MDAFDDIEKITPEEMEALAEVLQDATPAPPFMDDEDAVVLKYDLVGGSGESAPFHARSGTRSGPFLSGNQTAIDHVPLA